MKPLGHLTSHLPSHLSCFMPVSCLCCATAQDSIAQACCKNNSLQPLKKLILRPRRSTLALACAAGKCTRSTSWWRMRCTTQTRYGTSCIVLVGGGCTERPNPLEPAPQPVGMWGGNAGRKGKDNHRKKGTERIGKARTVVRSFHVSKTKPIPTFSPAPAPAPAVTLLPHC